MIKMLRHLSIIIHKNYNIYGYEFKWNPKRKAKFPKPFVEKYHATCHKINRDNFRDFIMY